MNDIPNFDPHNMLPWIAMMARMHAPAQIAAALTGTPLDLVLEIYESVDISPRIQLQQGNTNPDWFIRNATRSYHGAVIASFFSQVKDKYPGAVACAIAHAYNYYSRLVCGSRDDDGINVLDDDGNDANSVIPFSKAVDLLEYIFDIGQNPDTPALSVSKCSTCGALFISNYVTTNADKSCRLCRQGVSVQMVKE